MKPGLASLLDDMPKEPPDMSAVMAAKAKIESLMQKSGDLATPAAGGGSSTADATGAKSASSRAAAQGAAQIAAGLSHLTGGAINPTWFTEYNLPATLTRFTLDFNFMKIMASVMKFSIRFQMQVSENGGRSARDADESLQAATRSPASSDS